jgi:Sulfotransferase domain
MNIFLLIIIATFTLHATPFDQKKNAFKWENRVYLATYPRSGNHWMRFLIEEATHITTSSVYKDMDPPHLDTIFPWGGYCCEGGYEGRCRYPLEGEIAVIKNHYPTFRGSRFENLPYKKAVRVVRHPLDSFYSYYRYANLSIEEEIPSQAINYYISSWIRFQSHWDQAENVLTVRYEDLCRKPFESLKEILTYMGYTVSDEDIRRAINKYPPEAVFLKSLSHFTRRDLLFIHKELSEHMVRYGYTFNQVLF